MCVYVCMRVCLPVCLCVCMSVCMSTHMSVCLVIYMCLSCCLIVCTSFCICISLSLFCLDMFYSTCFNFRLIVCLSPLALSPSIFLSLSLPSIPTSLSRSRSVSSFIFPTPCLTHIVQTQMSFYSAQISSET